MLAFVLAPIALGGAQERTDGGGSSADSGLAPVVEAASSATDDEAGIALSAASIAIDEGTTAPDGADAADAPPSGGGQAINLGRVLRGHFAYYGIVGYFRALQKVHRFVEHTGARC